MNSIKRFAALVLALGFLCCAHAAQATSAQLPLDIKAQFGSIEITDTAYWDSPGSTWFVLVRTPDGVNRLLCYVLENGVWTQKFQTAAAMPQGKNRIKIYVTDKVLDLANDRTIPGPVLIVMQYGTGEHECVFPRRTDAPGHPGGFGDVPDPGRPGPRHPENDPAPHGTGPEEDRFYRDSADGGTGKGASSGR